MRKMPFLCKMGIFLLLLLVICLSGTSGSESTSVQSDSYKIGLYEGEFAFYDDAVTKCDEFGASTGTSEFVPRLFRPDTEAKKQAAASLFEKSKAKLMLNEAA